MNAGESLGVLTRELVRQAYLLASLDYFWISTWLSGALVLMVWFTRRTRSGAPVAAAE
jgi:DHA2 family multidrug resistance protein